MQRVEAMLRSTERLYTTDNELAQSFFRDYIRLQRLEVSNSLITFLDGEANGRMYLYKTEKDPKLKKGYYETGVRLGRLAKLLEG